MGTACIRKGYMKSFKTKKVLSYLVTLFKRKRMYDFSYNNIYYKVISYEERSVGVTKKEKGETPYYGDIEIPRTVSHNGCRFNVIEIDNNAFHQCSQICSVSIPDSIIEIKKNAFWGCTGLKKVFITDIANWCNIKFYGYSSNPLHHAKELYLNNTLVSKLIIPDGVNDIKPYTFSDYNSITEIVIQNGVRSIGKCAFQYCNNLLNITLPESIERIDRYAFWGCNKLKNIYIRRAIPPYTEKTALTIDETVLHIPYGSYKNYRYTEPFSLFRRVKEI